MPMQLSISPTATRDKTPEKIRSMKVSEKTIKGTSTQSATIAVIIRCFILDGALCVKTQKTAQVLSYGGYVIFSF